MSTKNKDAVNYIYRLQRSNCLRMSLSLDLKPILQLESIYQYIMSKSAEKYKAIGYWKARIMNNCQQTIGLYNPHPDYMKLL